MAVALVLAAQAVSARADDTGKAKPASREVQAVGEWAFKRLSAAHEALAKSAQAEALRALDELKGSGRLNAHEQALMWQTYGYVHASQERYREATAAFEQCLATGGLPAPAQLDTQYNLGQLYVMLERFDDAVRVFQDWFAKAENPSAEAHYVYAVALFEQGDKAAAVREGERALQKAAKPQEPWLQLVLSLYVERNEYAKAVGVCETLVGLYPKKAYWTQLSAVYSQVDDYRRALAALALAHAQGMLAEERELTHLAQLYLYNEVPYEAGRLLDAGLTAGTIAGSVQTWRLLADAWVSARERDQAERPLEKAAAQSDDGELYLRLAQIRFEREAWGPAREAFRRALEKGRLPDPGTAQLLLGIASANLEDWEQARTAFRAASAYEKSRKAAEQWLADLEAAGAARLAVEPVAAGTAPTRAGAATASAAAGEERPRADGS